MSSFTPMYPRVHCEGIIMFEHMIFGIRLHPLPVLKLKDPRSSLCAVE